jgi:uncharacterized protein
MSQFLHAIQGNLLTPPVLFFALGVFAALVKSNLKFPEPLYQSLTIYLLVAIGFKGGVALSKTDISTVWLPLFAALAVSALIPVVCYGVLRRRFASPDAASIAAHYGSASAVTFITACQYLDSEKVVYEPYVSALLALMEAPAIISGVLLLRFARRGANAAEMAACGDRSLRGVLHEAFTDKSVVLLVGAMIAGAVSGNAGSEATKPFFIAPFQGLLALFLLEMGVIAGRRLPDLRRVGFFLLGFALIAPLLNGALGACVGVLCGMSAGGATLFAVLSASASYIAVPAAMRVAIPEANPTYSLTAALAVTFPLNIIFGIPLYRMIVDRIN